jgi:hypothetical protein
VLISSLNYKLFFFFFFEYHRKIKTVCCFLFGLNDILVTVKFTGEGFKTEHNNPSDDNIDKVYLFIF